MRDVRLSKLTTINVAEGGDEKLFGLDDSMSNEQKVKNYENNIQMVWFNGK